MRKLFVLMFLIILLVGTVSAIDWDNKVYYSEGELTVDLQNSLLGILPTTEIGTLTLESHKSIDEIKEVTLGEQVVMWYKFNFVEDYSNGLGIVEFKNMKTGNLIDRDYSFVYLGNEIYEKPIYDCVSFSNEKNGLNSTACEQIGFEENTRQAWLPYNSKDIPKGEITIGLKTNVQENDFIDGIWTIVGKKIDKHASWAESPTNIYDDSSLGTQTWSNPQNAKTIDGNFATVVVNAQTSHLLKSVGYNFSIFPTGSTINGLEFNIYAKRSNEVGVVIYNLKAVKDGNVTGTGTGVGGFGETLEWYKYGGSTNLWGTTWTPEDINSGEFGFAFTVSNCGSVGTAQVDYVNATVYYTLSSGPNVTLLNPENNSIWDTPNLNFSGNITDDGNGIKNVSLILNGSIVSTNTSGDAGFYEFNLTNLPEGIGNWTIISYNNLHAGDSAGERYFTIDLTSPTINISYPLNDTNFPYLIDGNNLTLNTTTTDTNLDTCWYSYNNSNTTSPCTSGEINTTNFTMQQGVSNLTFWANDTSGNLNYSTTSWNYNILQMYQVYNILTYETASETFLVNVEANSSLTDVDLVWNGTSHNTLKSGSNYSTTFDIPEGTGNKSFYWKFTYGESTINSDLFYQTVNDTILGLCNATLTVPYINFTFKDEETEGSLNATIDSSTWTYWLGSGTVTKELLFSNNTENSNYAFCFTAVNDTLYNTRSIQYASSGYPQRKYDASSDLTNSTTNQLLYLLSSDDGIYSTIQVLDQNGNGLQGTEVTAERQFSGLWTVVGQETTDDAGSVTFWVNPDYNHKLTFVKDGCTGAITTIRPTQTQYTQVLNCGTNVDISGAIEGLMYFRGPIGGIIKPGEHNFTYRLISSRENIINASFRLINSSNRVILNSTSSDCTSEGCVLFMLYTIQEGENIKGMYYVDIGSGMILLEGDAWWKCIDISTQGKAGVTTFFKDIVYIFQEWGDNTATSDFNKFVIVFFLLCISFSVLNYHFNIDTLNPGAFLVGFTLIVFIGSGIAGISPSVNNQGLFYFTNLTGNFFLNNYILLFMCILITISYFIGVNRRNQ